MRDFNHSTASNADLSNGWSYISIPPIRLHGVKKNNFTVKCNSSHHQEYTYAVLLTGTFDMQEPDEIMWFTKSLRKLSETLCTPCCKALGSL